jgi:DNA polymerase-3 subunit gamma/tau
MVLNCEDRTAAPGAGEPCGRCSSCGRIWSGSTNLDVVEIDAASNRGVDDARELRERAMYAPSAPGRYKVYIVDEAHMLTREAWNALLKILEEPPPGVVFVFATTEPQKITNTAAPVMSRVQRFDFRRIGPGAIRQRLQRVAEQESVAVEEEALQLIARVADGGLRDALSLLDQALAFGEGAVTAARVRQALGLIDDEAFADLLVIVADHETPRVFPFVAELVEAGADLSEFVNGAGEVLRAMMVRKAGGQPEGFTAALREAIDRHADRYTAGDILRMLKLLGAAELSIRRSPNARLHVEALLAQWCLLDRTVELADVLEAVRAGSTQPSASPGSPNRGSRGGPASARQGRALAATETEGTGVTLEQVRACWSAILDRVGHRRRMVREALMHASPSAVHDGVVLLAVSESDVHLEGLEKSREVVEQAIGKECAGRVRVRYEPASASAEQETDRPRRMNRESDNRERLQRYRTRDAGLDTMAEALDLEVIE